MNTIDTICKRKSVRTYTGERITSEELNTVLKAANASPVGMGKFETMHLTIINSAEMLNKIEEEAAKKFSRPGMRPLYGAPTLVVVSAKKPEVGMENVVYSNAAMMCHNMAIAATDLGIGSCYIWGATGAISHNEEIIAELKLPEGFVPCCALTLGKTDEVFEMRDIPADKISKNFIE